MIIPKLSEFYWIIGCQHIEMFNFSPFLLGTNHFLYIDEEGLYRKEKPFFFITGSHSAIRGTAILMKSDMPKEVSATLTLDQVKEVVTWLTEEDLIKMTNRRKGCTHSHRTGNSEGETCMICGAVTGGFGAFRPYAKECVHIWNDAPDMMMKICIYCEKWANNERYDPNYKPAEDES
jgi:hypothetical protein